MPRLVVSIDGVVIKEVQLTKARTSVGRRPYNDIVIDNLAVSGEHAVFTLQQDGSVHIDDLGSTNGTYINGHAIKRQQLHTGDIVEMGKYKIRFLGEDAGPDYEKTMVFSAGKMPPALRAGGAGAGAATIGGAANALGAGGSIHASVRVVSGPAAGREVALQKIVTTIGKPGVTVASITKRHHGFVLTHVEGEVHPHLNGAAIGIEPVVLKNGDRIALAGTEMEFLQS